MLKKVNKLNTQEIKFLFDKKSVFFDFKIKRGEILDIRRYTVLLEKENKIKQETKFAVIFTKNLFKKAVERNKIRRILFTLAENYLKFKSKLESEYINNQDIYILIFPKKNILEKDYKEIEKEFYSFMV